MAVKGLWSQRGQSHEWSFWEVSFRVEMIGHIISKVMILL